MTLFCIFFLPITQIKVTSKLIQNLRLNNGAVYDTISLTLIKKMGNADIYIGIIGFLIKLTALCMRRLYA